MADRDPRTVFVEVPDDEPLGVRGPRQGPGVFEQDDDLVLLEPPGLVGADGVADLDAAGGDELADVAPRRPAEPRPQHLREREARLRGGNRKRCQCERHRYSFASSSSSSSASPSGLPKSTSDQSSSGSGTSM